MGLCAGYGSGCGGSPAVTRFIPEDTIRCRMMRFRRATPRGGV